jgi:hypothetical protein
VYVSRHVVFSETVFPACILTKKSIADDTESQSYYSDFGISLGTDTHRSVGNDSEASSQFEGDGEASADGEDYQDDEEGKDDDEGKDDEEGQVEYDQGGAGESADDGYAAQRLPSSIGTHRNPVEKSQHRYPTRERRQQSQFWVNIGTRATCHDINKKNIFNNLRSLQQCHTSQPVDTDTPSLKISLKSQDSELWEAAIHEELESLREAQTWDEVEASKGA